VRDGHQCDQFQNLLSWRFRLHNTLHPATHSLHDRRGRAPVNHPKHTIVKHIGIGIGIMARHQQTKTQKKYLYFSTETQASKTNNHYTNTVNNVSISINQQILTYHIIRYV